MTAPLRIAIVHYHLRPGGVTSILRHQAETLAQQGVRGVILAGKGPPDFPMFKTVAGLDYSGILDADPASLVRRLRAAARKALGGAPDLWHFHNHALGKNPTLSLAVHRMAKAGDRLLLHIHDFAEDGRPGNYSNLLNHISAHDPGRLAAIMYPQGPHVHYAVLSARDRTLLLAAGFPPAQVHVLPNPINCLTPMLDKTPASDRRLFLYPTRALRRKNLGEVLLWAAAANRHEVFGTTLAPTSATDCGHYEHWKKLARQLHLPVEFELGLRPGASFLSLINDASAIITTSIAEGFGLAFLEPWGFGRPLIGRNLPDLTCEFLDTGVELPSLYNQLWIPLDWVGKAALHKTLRHHLGHSWQAYGQPLPPSALDRALASMTRSSTVDFGRLDEALQTRVIRKLAGSRELRSLVKPHRPWLEFPGDELVARNREIIMKQFNLPLYGKRLMKLYSILQESQPGSLTAVSHDTLLAVFLSPERFSLLRT